MSADAQPQAPFSAVIRQRPEDFVVEELPAYGASGRGEHLFVTFRKRGVTTLDAVRWLSRALDTDPRGGGYAGLKDRHAVTTQTASFPFPIARDAEAAMAAVTIPGIEILGHARHDNKLKPGHLLGNRFTIVLREIPHAELDRLRARLYAIGRVGVPNAFGSQRFGRDGDNPERALAWLAGRERGPRNRNEQRLLFSALQSLLFNQVLERREADGTWSQALPGDVAKKHDTGGLFTVPLEGPEADDARARAEAGSISATGPMFGVKMRWPEGAPAALEREILEAALGVEPDLAAFRHLGEGTRRVLRLQVAELSVDDDAAARDRATAGMDPSDNGAGNGVMVVRFVLPKGGYATTVLGRACRLRNSAGSGEPARPAAEAEADVAASEIDPT